MTATRINQRSVRRLTPGAIARRRQVTREKFLTYVPLTLLLVFTLLPFYWMILFAFRPTSSTTLLPWPATLEHIASVWFGSGFGIYFWNSTIIGIASLLLTVTIASLSGYALARYSFHGKAVFMITMLCTQFIPGAMMLIPLFDIFRVAGLINTPYSLIVANVVFQLPLSILLMFGFVRNVPVDLEEASWLDGCSRFRGFLLVVLPLLRPALVAVGAFTFVSAWNEYLFALMFLNVQDQFTVPVGLAYLLGTNTVDLGALAAGGVLAATPVVLVFAFVQKYLVQGLSAGSVKG